MKVFNEGQQRDLISVLAMSVLLLDEEYIGRMQDLKWRSPLRRSGAEGLLLESWRCTGGYEYDEEDGSREIYFIDGIDKAC